MTEEIKEIDEIKETKKLAVATYSFNTTYGGLTNWSPEEVDKLETYDIKEFDKVISDCRFYYRKDPIASTIINKMVEIGITDVEFTKGKLSDNEFRIFTSIKPKLKSFIESCALEYLISGLVVPEVKYATVDKKQLMDFGIKKYDALTLPIKMWLRDPMTIKIEKDIAMNEPSYYAIVPEDLIFFIQHEGTYRDGNKDPKLYSELLLYYPEFVAQVKAGVKEVLLDNNKIIRRKVITGSQYPTPYLFPALESLKHKRNIRRMDYSIASRVIEAIQLIQLGNDEYPVLEGEESQFDDIKQKMAWRNTQGKSLERIFQLFANHTLQITWVSPDVEALLNEGKYKEVNQDIFLALGFPKILTTGETERTQTSNSEFATLSPEKSMINLQDQMLKIVRVIVRELSELNGLKEIPESKFSRINLHAIADFVSMMNSLIDHKVISPTSYADAFGYNYEEESNQSKEDLKVQKEMNDIITPPEENMP
jgi:hypothetical protein